LLASCHHGMVYLSRKTALLFLITHKLQLRRSEGVWLTRFMGVWGQDGHSQAPTDGFMASLEMGEPNPE